MNREQAATHPDYVFIDRDGDVWGYSNLYDGRAPNQRAKRPFKTYAEAREGGISCYFGCVEVREWRPTDRVPPMPDGAA